MGLEYLRGLAGDVEPSIISYNNGKYSTCMERTSRRAHSQAWHVHSKAVEHFQLEGAGSIRPQLHMIFHFVEIGDCETLAKCRFGVGGCPDIARSVTLLPLCMSVTELQEYVEALNRTDNLVTEQSLVDCQPRLVRNPARIL